ncbi:unnamed protein product [Notodromas monacha]|uniref:Cysteine synthase n=1 Tax=Notodromas monacha TaxID=399045 RepID=A0A7R9GMD9_9CRUS|nr:unnamed protein product [Notodromas monacha]CAG0926011.1 unnamed protein product [Notodromas monacha]
MIQSLIGNTPLVEITRLNPNPDVKILAKLEGQNPGGSVKDRAAYNMLTQALERGDIAKGSHLVEATSGNTGIALAMIANLLGLKMTLVMPAGATAERIRSMKAYGAELILTDNSKGIEYSRVLAEELSNENGYAMPNQFANDDNLMAHYKTTGPEIWRDTNGLVTHFVSSMGTTGTIMGTSKYLKEQNPKIQIIGAQPTEGSSIPGIRRWTPEFLPKIYDPSRVDLVMDVSQAQAIHMTRELAKVEGIMAGMSSGGALHIALEMAKKIDHGTIVFIVCDRGDRYLSSDLFEA